MGGRICMFWWMWVWPFDLYEAFGAYGLIATPRSVEVRGIIEKANRAFHCVFVETRFERLAVNVRLVQNHSFLRLHVLLRGTASGGMGNRCQCF